MDTLKALIEKTDDEYLTGLSNKGTVKRAYKDLEQETPELTWQDNEALVTLKDVTCVLRAPLGESSCSCSSRSICRHIVAAVLWLRQNSAKEEKKIETAAAGEGAPRILKELLQIPADRLKRACKSRGLRQLLAHMRAGEFPHMEESSFVTVVLPWDEATVKLLEPFAYSTCTCHSRELCPHKAQAVLAYQIKKGKISLEELDTPKEAAGSWDEMQVKQACRSVREALSHQICTGLSRQPSEISESLERLAVITHRAGLPSLERGLRETAACYRQYFSRSAAFRNEELLGRILMLHQKAQRLEKAKDQEEIRALAGTFRDAYEPAGRLHLVGMGGRTFSSKTGYEGEIYYFLEAEQKKWYTWTDARPVFYEGTRRRPPSALGGTAAPWNLNCSREQMQELEFRLQGAKAAAGGRLSASKDTKGEIVGNRSLEAAAVRSMIIWDYERLLQDCYKAEDAQSGQNKAAGIQERLALVGAVRYGNASFDTVQQRFSWSLYDGAGRQLFISMKYTKEERMTINLLERLEQRLKNRPQGAVVFFGSLYMDEDSRLCLYPIEVFLKEAECAAEAAKTERHGNAGDDRKAHTEQKTIAIDILDTMEQYQKEASEQILDLFFSGLYSVQEETIKRLSELSEDAERLGLHKAGEILADISRLLQEKRHQMEFSPEPVTGMLGKLNTYLWLCQKKLAYDKALFSMRRIEEDQKF